MEKETFTSVKTNKGAMDTGYNHDSIPWERLGVKGGRHGLQYCPD
jgi:hypothetical protein